MRIPAVIWPLLCLTCLLGASDLRAQRTVSISPDVQEIPLKKLGTDEGLSQGFVVHVAEDHYGYLWMSTKDGLNRYDGTGITVYRHRAEDKGSISDNMILSVFADSKDRLWAFTQKGLDLLDRERGSFIHLRDRPGYPKSDLTPMQHVLCEDKSGAIWIKTIEPQETFWALTASGKAGQSVPDFQFRHLHEVYPGLAPLLAGGRVIEDCHAMTDGSVWLTQGDSLYRFTAAALKGETGHQVFYATNPVKNYSDGSISLRVHFDNRKAHVYMNEDSTTLTRYDEASGRFLPFLKMPAGRAFDSRMMISRDERLWMWMRNGDVGCVDLNSGSMQVIHLRREAVDSNLLMPIAFLQEDRCSNLWISTGGYGLYKIGADALRFKSIRQRDRLSFHGSYMTRMMTPENHALYDSALISKWLALSSKVKLTGMHWSDFWFDLVYDGQRYFWLWTLTDVLHGNLIKIDSRDASYRVLIKEHEMKGVSLGYPMFATRNGDIWMGDLNSPKGTRLIRIKHDTEQIDTFFFGVSRNTGGSRFISDWHEDPNGLLWLGTMMGLYSFDPLSHQFQHFESKTGDSSSLSSNKVLSVCPDPAEPMRYLWLGTEGGGLNWFDRKTGKCIRFNTHDGLPNDVVYAVQSDAHHNLWLSTNQGLCLFDPRTHQVRNFTKADGLCSDEFNRFQYSKAADGSLYFGGIGGLTNFDPNDFYKKSSPSKVVFTHLKLLNKEVEYPGANHDKTAFHLPAPIDQCKELVLNYDQQMITLSFALLDLTNPTRNKFRYKMEGFNTDWIDAGTETNATFTNLAPGEYIFKVMGINSSNVTSTEPASIRIVILPPWWATWWFRLIAAMAVIAALYALYRYRLQQLLHMERMRNRIAQDLHDEIGSTLSSISLYSAVMQKTSTNLSEQTYAILDKIIQSTSQMMESMNDMVWTIKADNDSFEQVVNRMRAFAVNMTEVKDIALHFNADKAAEHLQLNMDQRKNIYLIFKEAVNNAVKYSGCKNLYVTLRDGHSVLTMSIADDGKGFDQNLAAADKSLLGGNGLRGMKLRAREIGANLTIDSDEKGTRIMLIFHL